jgi:hypothetical protein
MWYVQAQGDTFIRHIFDVEPTQWDADNYCYARRLTDEQVEHFGVHKNRSSRRHITMPPRNTLRRPSPADRRCLDTELHRDGPERR